MLIYYIPIVWLFTLSNIKLGKHKNLLEKITVFLLGIFLCTTYFTGSDWRAYEKLYELNSFENLGMLYGEIGYHVYSLIFKSLGFDFWYFFIITKLWCFYIFYKKIKERSNNIFFVLMLCYFYIFLYLFIDCPLRNLIAVGIFLLSENFLLKKKYIKYYLFCILAFLFHKSSFFMFFLPFVKRISKINRFILFGLLIIANIIFLDKNLLIKLIELLPFGLDMRILKYSGGRYFESSIFSLGNVEKIVIILFILFNKNKILKFKEYNKYLISILIIYYIFYRLSFIISIFGRFGTYFIIYYIFNINLIYDFFKKNINKKSIIIFFFMYGILMIYKTTLTTYNYLPYTSYLSYIFKEKPSYQYRKNYAFYKYIERRGKDSYIEKYLK